MKKLLKYIFLMSIILFSVNSIISCDKDDSDPIDSEGSNVDENSFDISNLNGLWMETHYIIDKSAIGEEDQTIILDGMNGGNNYKYCRITVEEEDVTIQWLSVPSLSVLQNVNLRIEGNKLMKGEELFGTIQKCSDSVSSSEAALIIEWEENAQPFNINGQFPETAYYIRDTWSK